jgi:hypothetical protein
LREAKTTYHGVPGEWLLLLLMEHHRSDHDKRSPEIAAICLKIQKTKNILKSIS